MRRYCPLASFRSNVFLVAEGEGFEPPVEFPPQWFSRPPPSTTRPSLRVEMSPEFARSRGSRFRRRMRLTKPSFLAESREVRVGHKLRPNVVSLRVSPPPELPLKPHR